jgi:hypothetical protein
MDEIVKRNGNDQTVVDPDCFDQIEKELGSLRRPLANSPIYHSFLINREFSAGHN